MNKGWKLSLILFSVVVLGAFALTAVTPFRPPLLAEMLLALSSSQNKVPAVATPSVATRQNPTGLGLGFPTKGVVKHVYVKVGDHVAVGDRLADLDTSLLVAQLSEAKATLDIQKATLARLRDAPSVVDLTVLQEKLYIAQANVDDANRNLFAAILDAYTKGDDAIRGKADQVFTTPQLGPQFILVVTDSQASTNLNTKRAYVEAMLVGWKNMLANITTSDDLTPYLAPAEANSIQIRNFLANIGVVLNGAYQDSTNSATTIRNWRFDLSTARANIETGLKNFWAAEGKLQNTKFALAIAQADLDQKKSPPTAATIALQQGKVNAAQAKIDILQANIDQMTLVAPTAGVVSRMSVQVGAMPNSFSPVIYLKSQ